jgi:hypothetical protein
MFTVTQEGLWANVSYAGTLFPTDGGGAFVNVTTEGNAQWEAVSNTPWLRVADGSKGTGSGSVLIVADLYTNTSQSRSGSVTVAGKVVNFTQRGYQLSILPRVAEIGSNSGAGEFGVAAPITAVWEAIVSQPWITLLGSSSGAGTGTVRYSIAANTTGQTRTGSITVAGEEYTITQKSGFFVNVVPSPGGNVTGGGAYNGNDTVKLLATPSPGYIFSNWSGDIASNANPLVLVVDANKTIQANFILSTSGGESVRATNISVKDGRFGFEVSGSTGLSFVVEAAADPSRPVWRPLHTNSVVGGTASFSDAQWFEFPSRIYRIRKQ